MTNKTKQNQIKTAVMTVLIQFAKAQPLGDLRLETIFDPEQDRYQVMVLGVMDGKPFHECLAYVTLHNQHVYLEIDNSDFDLPNALKKAGIPETQLMFGTPAPSQPPMQNARV